MLGRGHLDPWCPPQQHDAGDEGGDQEQQEPDETEETQGVGLAVEVREEIGTTADERGHSGEGGDSARPTGGQTAHEEDGRQDGNGQRQEDAQRREEQLVQVGQHPDHAVIGGQARRSPSWWDCCSGERCSTSTPRRAGKIRVVTWPRRSWGRGVGARSTTIEGSWGEPSILSSAATPPTLNDFSELLGRVGDGAAVESRGYSQECLGPMRREVAFSRG